MWLAPVKRSKGRCAAAKENNCFPDRAEIARAAMSRSVLRTIHTRCIAAKTVHFAAMRHDNSKRLNRAAAFSDSAATELSIAAAVFEEQGNEVVAQALREQARTHRAQAIQLKARAVGEAARGLTRDSGAPPADFRSGPDENGSEPS